MVAACLYLTTAAHAVQPLTRLIQCNTPGQECTGNEEAVQAVSVPAGQPFEMYLDYHIAAGDLNTCLVEVSGTYDSDQLLLVGAERRGIHPTEVVACEVGFITSSPRCAECDREFYCQWFDPFDDLVLTTFGAEIGLEFQVVGQGDSGVYAGLWYATGLDATGDCSVDLSNGLPAEPDFPDVMVTVPEPGAGAMLATGIPALAVLARRRRERRVP
jgi:hypothetical protein